MGLKASRSGLVGHDDPASAAQCTRAAAGDQGAWDDVWLLLVEQLGKPPEPAALAGWLAATTRRECLRAALAELPASCLERMRESSALLSLADIGGNRPGGDPGA